MRLLLDTHALLWWLSDAEALGQQARDLIEDPNNDVLVSVVALWEIVAKTRTGKLEADIQEIATAIKAEDFDLLGIEPAHLLTLAGLPRHHKDPFDQLLIARAITAGATFVSEDRHTSSYPVTFVTCSDSRPHS